MRKAPDRTDSKTEIIESQSQQPQRTADQMIKDDRCVIPRELFDKAQIIASENKMTNCEIQVNAIAEFVDLYQLKKECSSGNIPPTDERCRFVATRRG